MTTITQLKWRMLSADAYEASGGHHQYAVLFLGFDAETPWLATTSDRRYAPRPEQSLRTSRRICQAWADDMNGDNDDK
jgi:hypothetical protein